MGKSKLKRYYQQLHKLKKNMKKLLTIWKNAENKSRQKFYRSSSQKNFLLMRALNLELA